MDGLFTLDNLATFLMLTALQAVIRGKLLYGLETAQPNQGVMNRLEVFQLKALRKIFKMKSTGWLSLGRVLRDGK